MALSNLHVHGLIDSSRQFLDLGTNKAMETRRHTMFIKHYQGKKTILIVYVNDIVVTKNDHEEVHMLKYLAKEFENKDLGRLRYFLGIEVARSSKGIFIS